MKETAPGLFTDIVTVPVHLLVQVDTGNNLAPIPDSQKKDDPSHIKPEEVKGKDTANVDSPPYGSSANDNSLPAKNTPGKGKKWDDSKPGGGNMIKGVYLEALERY
mgnify:FL=1